MGFVWPAALALLILAPLALWAYRRGLAPPARTAVLHPDLAALARSRAGGWRRHAAAASYFAAGLLALFAVARPTVMVPEPDPRAGIVLALDTSWSMQATDIEPNRFEAAREALRAFVRELPAGTRVGLVTFSGYATLVAPLSDDHQRLLAAVDHFVMGRGTVIGEAILTAVEALPGLEERLGADDPERLAAIVLLSDGRNRGGIDPLAAAALSRQQRVPIHTVGVGASTSGPVPGIPGEFGFAARFDEATLRAIAEETGGRYLFVDTATELRSVYRGLSRSLAWRTRREEVAAFAALAAAALLLFSLALSERRRRVA